jgi:hypothetical protein
MARRAAARSIRAAAVALVLAVAQSAHAASPAHVNVTLGGKIRPVPPAFLGLSIEPLELGDYAQYLPQFSRLMSAIEPAGATARPIIRIGGESADSSFLGPDPFANVAPDYRQSRPYVLTPDWMNELGALTRSANVRLIFDLNLAAHSPAMAAQVAQAATNAVPGGRIVAFEIGNEPDLYANALVGITRAEPDGPNAWAFSFGIGDYVSLFAQYAQAIRKVLPKAAFAGPSGMTRSPYWVSTLLDSSDRSMISLVTAHNYPPFEGCAPPGSSKYPNPAGYLADSVANGVAHSELYVLAASMLAGLKLRMTEVGSSVCGGVAGRSDTFATALWAPDLLFNMLAVGISGVNIHLRGNGFANTALDVTPEGIYAEPLYYGMALFARMLGPGAQLMVTNRSGGPERLKVWAVRLRDGTLHLLYLNKSSRDALVALPAQSNADAVLQRLRGASLRDNASVTLAGQRFGADGSLQGTPQQTDVPVRGHRYRVFVPAFSGAMLSIPPS